MINAFIKVSGLTIILYDHSTPLKLREAVVDLPDLFSHRLFISHHCGPRSKANMGNFDYYILNICGNAC